MGQKIGGMNRRDGVEALVRHASRSVVQSDGFHQDIRQSPQTQ